MKVLICASLLLAAAVVLSTGAVTRPRVGLNWDDPDPETVPRRSWNVTFHDKKMTYLDALKFCKEPNENKQELLEVHDASQNAWIYDEMQKRGLKRLWLAYSRRQKDQDEYPKEFWRWEVGINTLDRRGSRMTFWGPGEPNNYQNHSERCLEMRVLPKNDALHNWNDRPCGHLNAFACMQRGY